MTIKEQMEAAKAEGVEVVILIYGKAGAGKSRLARSITDQLGGGSRRVRAYTTQSRKDFRFAEIEVTDDPNWNKEFDE